MKRPILGFIAITVALMIVFAPGPSRGDRGMHSHLGENFRAGRILAPTLDATDVTDQDVGRLIHNPGSRLLAVFIAGIALTASFRPIFILTESPAHGALSTMGSRGSRGPPSTLF
jgi:hypothetical protein